MSSVSGVGSAASDVKPTASSSTAISRLLTETPQTVQWDEDILDLQDGVETSTEASNDGSMFGTLNQSILISGNFDGVQDAIDTYTGSLANSTVYDSPYTAPSAQFLGDLAQIKADASSGNLKAAETNLQAAKLADPTNSTGGISEALFKHNYSGVAAIEEENTVNTSHYLVSQGMSVADANKEALSVTAIQPFVVQDYNTPATTQQQAAQVSDLATSLSKTEDFTQTEAIPASAAVLSNIIEKLLGAMFSTSDSKAAATANHQALAAMDSLYGTKASDTSAAASTAQVGSAVSNYA